MEAKPLLPSTTTKEEERGSIVRTRRRVAGGAAVLTDSRRNQAAGPQLSSTTPKTSSVLINGVGVDAKVAEGRNGAPTPVIGTAAQADAVTGETDGSYTPWVEGTEPFEYQAEFTSGRNISAIKCNRYDDDNVEDVASCGPRDIDQCDNILDTSSADFSNFFSTCGDACSDANMDALTTWAYVCSVEAVKSWRDTCDGSFTATVPSWSSRNHAPKATPPTRNPDFDACHEHAWCYACEDDNAFCNFFETLYDVAEAKSLVGLFQKETFDFFCDPDVIDAIEGGSFWVAYQAGDFDSLMKFHFYFILN